MKKIIISVLLIALTVVFFGCSKGNGDLGKQTTVDKDNGYTLVQEVKTFKMNDDEKAMKQLDGVQKDGFVTDEANKTGDVASKTDAIDLAKKEVSLSYNSIRVNFDRTRGIWKIVFSNDEEIKGDDGQKHVESNVVETVYVDEEGYTIAIYKGEVK